MTAPLNDPAPRDEPTVPLPASTLLQLALLQESEHAIIVLDARGLVVAWMGNAARLFGYETSEMVGRSLERLYTAEDMRRGALAWSFDAARDHGKVEEDRWHVRRDGVRVWTSGSTTPIKDARDAVVGFVRITRDRTALRAQVESLQGSASESERAEGRRNVVFGLLAHELRNPLGEITNASHIIGRIPANDARVESCVRIIGRQVDYIQNVVRDLLETTRDAAGKARLHYERIELREVIDHAVETCSRGLVARGQSVEVNVPGGFEIEGDSIRLQQVLVNLIVNASKYSAPHSRIAVKVTVDPPEAVIRVEDEGRGIDPRLLPRIFELFARVGEEGEEAGHGLGLGLSVVRNIVEMHGGTVQANSEGNGKGAQFIVRLPLRKP